MSLCLASCMSFAEAGNGLDNGDGLAGDAAKEEVVSAGKKSRFTIGGYGEAVMTRNFYSDNWKRYTDASKYKDAKGHGQFDLPHVVVMMGYDFGKGWSMGMEIEFEHGGSGGAIEKEAEEGGEWEAETEKGGEVELEQFWVQKSFADWANIRFGHIVVPFGLTNAHHEPLNFFTVYRPEGERTIIPSTWHQTGVSFFGRSGAFRYELQLTGGLDAMLFDRTYWIGKGAQSPWEFEVANKFGVLARIDNYTVPGLRIGLSGYYGKTMHNTFPHDLETDGNRYKDIEGNLYLGSFDFTYNAHNWIARGYADYGYVSDAQAISAIKANQSSGTSPYRKTAFGSHAVAVSVEAGYDVFSQFEKLRRTGQKLYVFGHYEYYDSYVNNVTNTYTNKNIVAAGVNYYPVPQIAVKAEYNHRFLKSRYNDEPTLNIGVAYEGFFL